MQLQLLLDPRLLHVQAVCFGCFCALYAVGGRTQGVQVTLHFITAVFLAELGGYSLT